MDQKSQKDPGEQENLPCVRVTTMVNPGEQGDTKSEDTSVKKTKVVQTNIDTAHHEKVQGDTQQAKFRPESSADKHSLQEDIQPSSDGVQVGTVTAMSGGSAKNSVITGQITGDVTLKGLELYEQSTSIKRNDRRPANIPLTSRISNVPEEQICDAVAGNVTQEYTEQTGSQVADKAIPRPVEQEHDRFRNNTDTATKQETDTQQTGTVTCERSVENAVCINHVIGNVTVKVPKCSAEFNNMIKNTRTTLASDDQRKHVVTFGERSALKLLRDFGCVFIKGRSGTGKSRLGRSLLTKLQGRTPVMVCRPEQWDAIPMSGNNKYVALIDDMFGSSKVIEAKVDGWESMFMIMWPSVESGHIAIVITSRTEISAQVIDRFKSFTIMKQMKYVCLDDEKYFMKPREKRMFIKKYMGGNHNLQESEIKQLTKMESSLGFPQCCVFYSCSKESQSRGLKFFQKPFECLQDLISTMKACDPLEYVVLMLVMMHSGHLDLSFLHPRQPVQTEADTLEFNRVVDQLSRTCNLASPPACGEIQTKAECLLGVYLCKIGNEYQFQHPSIFDALFLDLVKQYPEMCVQICPADMLVELVHTTDEHGQLGVSLDKDRYDILAERVTELLFFGCSDILCNSSLIEKEFLEYILEDWQQQTLIQQRLVESVTQEKIIFYQIPSGKSTFVKYEDRHSVLQVIERNLCLFECQSLLGNIILTNHSIALSLVKMTENNHRIRFSNQALTCAIYTGQTVIIRKLMQKSLTLEETSFRALCASNINDEELNRSILDQLKLEWDTLRDVKDMLFLSSLNGNVAVVQLLLSRLSSGEIFDCLKSIYLMMGHSRRFVCYTLDTKKLIKLEMVIGAFMKSLSGREWTERMIDDGIIQLCASHTHDVGLKAILDRNPKLTQGQWSSLLQNTLCNGVLVCVHELLKYNTDHSMIAECLCNATKARLQSEEKTGLMLKYFKAHDNSEQEKHKEGSVNFQNKAGCAPLHYASMHGRIAIMKMLLDGGADVHLVSKSTNMAPLNFAVCHNQLEAVNLLLGYKANVNFKSVLLDAKVSEIVKCLVSAGANVNAVDKRGRTALFMAAENDELEAAKVLCNESYDINRSDNKGVTALHIACWYGDLDFVQYLLNSDASVTVDNAGMSVLHYAARSRNEAYEKIQYLLQVTSVDVNITDNEEKTPLFPAVTNTGNMDVVELLKDKGAVINKRDTDGETVLHKACLWTTTSPLKVVTYLLDIGVNPNLHGRKDQTALHMILKRCEAMKSKQNSKSYSEVKQTCCLLIKNTSDVNHTDSDGVTPLRLTKYIGDEDILRCLLEKKTGDS